MKNGKERWAESTLFKFPTQFLFLFLKTRRIKAENKPCTIQNPIVRSPKDIFMFFSVPILTLENYIQIDVGFLMWHVV